MDQDKARACRAHWLTADVLACPWDLFPGGADGLELELWHSAADSPGNGTAGWVDPFRSGPQGVLGLQRLPGGLPGEVAEKAPHLRDHLALRVVGASRDDVARVLHGALAFVARRSGGTAGIEVRTGVQIGGVLDDLYGEAARARTLGVTWRGAVGTPERAPSLAVWAPTARLVTLLLFESDPLAAPTRVPMLRHDDGAWTCVGEPGWADLAYRYDVAGYVPEVGAVVVGEVTDPYSVALTTGSTHSVLVDMADPAYRPEQWEATAVPGPVRPVDRTIYELHVRDFSISDATVPPEHRGTYLAFAGEGDGVAHLRALAEAGLNTVHLLPAFDFASVPEDRERRREPAGDLGAFPPDSLAQQDAVGAVRTRDSFNWGYDPVHFQAPEGSYASAGHQDGGARLAEFRTMVGALHGIGLQVVLDQVYNHTYAHGQAPESVLDRVVPGYYHRLDARGEVHTSTCCPNVATERVMAEKLMVDSVVHWARHHRIGGFRFDLMGHHSRANMLAVRAALDALTAEQDGIDGRGIYLYGEGWDFGEVAHDRLFVQARQGNLGGTGIGTFSDRLRDAVQGGSAASHGSLLEQGFATGLATEPNGADTRPPGERHAELAHLADLVRLGMTGNLRAFSFLASSGRVQRGDEIDYRGQRAGYADSPEEVVSYVDAHDNHTLFDLMTLKLATGVGMVDRIRMTMLALATTALAQTPMLWHAGTDLLRSKSLDVDSYDSGDWFNVLDFSGRDNGFGRGLPPAWRNERLWPVYAPFLARADLRPTPEDIAHARAWARDLLRLRAATPLLRLGSTDQILTKVTVPGSGPGAQPGVVVLAVDDRLGPDADPSLDGVLVVLNATPHEVSETVAGLAGRVYGLSPVHRSGVDPVVRRTTWDAITGTVRVPARTAVVLVEPQVG